MIEEAEKRFKICRKCPICDVINGICNGNLYLNPETNDVSIKPKKDYIKGCGCMLEYKIMNKSSKCPANKW